jgi:hypothetical protein
MAFSTATAVTELAAKQDPDFSGIVNVDGLLYTGNLLLCDYNYLPAAYQRGRIIHPNMLEFCISDISHPLSSESYFSLANDNIYMSKDTRVVKKLEVDGILNANNGLNVLGTATGITKDMVGLGNVNNTSDANKPISTAPQTALNAISSCVASLTVGAISGLTSTNVGLGNVDNTSDLNKPVSTATQTALNLKK